MDIEVLPPDVNRSAQLIVAGGKICFALSAVKGCGGERRRPSPRATAGRPLSQPLRLLRAARSGHGQSHGRRIAGQGRGAGRPWADGRAQQFAAIDRAVQAAVAAASDRRSGQLGLFDATRGRRAAAAVGRSPQRPRLGSRDQLAKEKEVLGFYLSSHPLAEHEKTLAAYCSHTTTAAGLRSRHRTEVMLGGLISGVKLASTENPKPGNPSRYAVFDLEDTSRRDPLHPLAGTVRPATATLVEADAIRVFRGVHRQATGNDEANLIIHEIIDLPDLEARATRSVWDSRAGRATRAGEAGATPRDSPGYPGKYPLGVDARPGRRRATASVPCSDFRVAISPQMQARVEELLGPGNFRLRHSHPDRQRPWCITIGGSSIHRDEVDSRLRSLRQPGRRLRTPQLDLPSFPDYHQCIVDSA